ncbi:hypothetical protein DFH29DRAFT_982593 [Suillus ampliporus]|nr:hypothetical protein DFH29DRAFT_982593 [Suillus ampliporus]
MAQASFTLLTSPVRLLGRIRRLTDTRWVQSSDNSFAFTRGPDLHPNGIFLLQSPPPVSTPVPGPWSFLTSWYVIGLMTMAVLLHRIRNIVVPPRHQFINHLSRIPGRNAFMHSAIPSVFPLDLSSSMCRLVLRSPSLYLVFKMLFIWVIVLAQAAEKFPMWSSSWLQSVGTYVAQRETADLCWSTFCAVCGVLCMEGLTHGLEGGAHRPSPFNLLGYAFLLHTYSSPVTHEIKLEGSTSRPDNHVVFTIILPLLQLAIIHLIGIKQDWSSHRLFPSAFVSFLGLAHFHSVLWLSDSSYPLLNYVPSLFDSTLLAVVFLALFLNVFTQIATEGTVSRFLFGHQAALLPKWDEDFSVALLRLGYSKLRGVECIGPRKPSRGRRCSSIKYRRFKKGFANEIKTVRVTSTGGDIWLDMVWCRELARLGVGVVRCGRGLIMKFWNVLRRRSRRPPNFPPRRVAVRSETAKNERNQDLDTEDDEEELYERFMRGELMHEDEDDEDLEYQWPLLAPTSSRSEHGDEDNEEESQQDANETVSLFSDLSSAPSAVTSASVLLAHMTDNSSSPMTRQRFQHLMSAPSQRSNSLLSDWTDVAATRRSSSSGTGMHDDSQNEARRNCVICTVEPRQIICWPCRWVIVRDSSWEPT